MTGQITDKVRVYVAPESTFGTDPDADGSDYLALPCKGSPYPVDGTTLEDLDYATGRNHASAMLPTASGGTLDLEVPLIGFSAYANDGTAPPTADAVDAILSSAFGTGATFSGEGINASGTNSTTHVSPDTDIAAVEDLILINLTNGRSRWAVVTAEAAGPPIDYTVSPTLPAAADPASDIMGSRYWVPTIGGGATIAVLVERDGKMIQMLGSRPTSLKMKVQNGAAAMLSVSLRADSFARISVPASLPASAKPSTAPTIKGMLGACVFNGTEYAVKSAEIDFNLQVTDLGSITGANGRSDIFVVSARPTLSIEPLYADAWEDAFQAGTEGPLLLQFGSGVRVSGRCPSFGFYAQSAQVSAQKDQDDGGVFRKAVTLRVTDPGIRTGTTAYRQWTLSRA